MDCFQQTHESLLPSLFHQLGVLLYAIRLLGLESEVGPRLDRMRQRLWDAQTESGGVAHFIELHPEDSIIAISDPTGEATSIAILAEVVAPLPPARILGSLLADFMK